MLIPFNHPEIAAQEIRFAREHCGLEVAFANPTPPDETPWSHPRYDIVWSTLEELDVTMTFHESSVGAGPTTVGINRYWADPLMLYLCTHTVEPQLAVMDLIGGGVLHRHPRLKVGLLEAHVSWVKGWMELMDYRLGAAHAVRGGPLTMPPSDYFRRQIFVAVFADDVGIAEAFDYLGPDNLVYSSDWPHKSLDAVDCSASALEARADLTDDMKIRLLETNAGHWLHV